MSVLYIRDESGNFIPIQAIKGKDGKDAPADVVRYGAQTLTDEQKEQARANIDAAAAFEVGNGLVMDGETLGVKPEGVYELIEAITINEEVSIIVRDAEPDGKLYSFKSLYLYIEAPKAEASGILYTYINGKISAPMLNTITQNYAKGGVAQMKAEISYGLLDSYGIGAFNQDTSATYNRYVTKYNVPDWKKQ